MEGWRPSASVGLIVVDCGYITGTIIWDHSKHDNIFLSSKQNYSLLPPSEPDLYILLYIITILIISCPVKSKVMRCSSPSVCRQHKWKESLSLPVRWWSKKRRRIRTFSLHFLQTKPLRKTNKCWRALHSV